MAFILHRLIQNAVGNRLILRFYRRLYMINSWEELEKACKACQQCQLCAQRSHVVFGVGSQRAEVLFIGEGPGMNEDLQGEPFVCLLYTSK